MVNPYARFAVMLALGAGLPSAALCQQEPSPRSLPIVIHDKHGNPQQNITAQDLQLIVDSKPATITSLQSDSGNPLSLGLLIDTSKRQEQVLTAEKKPDAAFLGEHVTRPGDKSFVIHFDNEIELMEDLTTDKARLHAAIEDLKPGAEAAEETREDDSSDTSDDSDSPRRHRPGGTRLYDAIFLASDEVLHSVKGRKTIVVISDGVDRGSKESLASAVESAQRSGTVVYTVYVEGERDKDQENRRGDQNGGQQQQRRSGGGIGWPSGGGGYPGGGQSGGGQSGGGQGGGNGRSGQRKPAVHEDGKKVLLEISRKTGGAWFEAKKKEDIEAVLTQISQYLQNEYQLTFQADPASTGDFHRLSVTAHQSKWSIQAPEAYYSH